MTDDRHLFAALFRCQVFKLAKGLVIGDIVFTTLRWTETFHTTDTQITKDMTCLKGCTV